MGRVSSTISLTTLSLIRAPLIEAVHKDAEALASLPDGRIIAAKQGRLLATSFHPELTLDDRFHRYFLELTK